MRNSNTISRRGLFLICCIIWTVLILTCSPTDASDQIEIAKKQKVITCFWFFFWLVFFFLVNSITIRLSMDLLLYVRARFCSQNLTPHEYCPSSISLSNRRSSRDLTNIGLIFESNRRTNTTSTTLLIDAIESVVTKPL